MKFSSLVLHFVSGFLAIVIPALKKRGSVSIGSD